MSQSADESTAPTGYNDYQIVVALEHRSILEAELEGLRIGHYLEKTSDALALALVDITDVKSAARMAMVVAEEVARAQEAQDPTSTGASHHPAPGPNASALDNLLWALRLLFKARYAGWTPTLGKNRIVGHVHAVYDHGLWQVIHTGDDDPKPIDPPPEFAARATGPGSGVRVGVLDTAIYPQPWLAGAWAARFSDLVAAESDSTVAEGHATFVAGLILSQAPGATVEVRRVLDENGVTDAWTAAEAIVQFGQSGLDVLNLSFACYTEDNEAPLVLATAIDRLDPKLVVVAAAGNYGGSDAQRNRPAWPAALDDVIAVGAGTASGDRASFSPDAPWVDVHTLGVDLKSTYLDSAYPNRDSIGKVKPREFGGWATWRGTSFSAALFTGAVAAAAMPDRIAAVQAARDILDSLRTSNARTVSNTHSKFLPLRTR